MILYVYISISTKNKKTRFYFVPVDGRRDGHGGSTGEGNGRGRRRAVGPDGARPRVRESKSTLQRVLVARRFYIQKSTAIAFVPKYEADVDGVEIIIALNIDGTRLFSSNRSRATVFLQLVERSADGNDHCAVAEETSDRSGVEHPRSSGAHAHFHDTAFRTQKPEAVGKHDRHREYYLASGTPLYPLVARHRP